MLRLILLTAAGIAVAPVALGRAETIAEATPIVQRAVAALGGRAQLEALRGWMALGTIESSAMPGTFRADVRLPDRVRTRIEITAYLDEERRLADASGWQTLGNVRQLTGIDLVRLRRCMFFEPFIAADRAGVSWRWIGRERVGEATTDVVERSVAGRGSARFYFDSATSVPLQEVHDVNGQRLTLRYGDYRLVSGVRMPHSVRWSAPRQSFAVRVTEYRMNVAPEDSVFVLPAAARAPQRSYDVSLGTIPRRVFRVDESGGAGPSQAIVFNVVVAERNGRRLEPRSASVELHSGTERVKTITFSAAALRALEGITFERRAGVAEIFDLRHQFSEPSAPAIDRVVYHLELRGPVGRSMRETLTIPVTEYRPATRLVFPLKGSFLVTNGHTFDRVAGHHEWSQQYAYDVMGLGERGELVKRDGATNEDFMGWGREILAPAAGRVVSARNDVPDNSKPGVFEGKNLIELPNPDMAITGNHVLIDHGAGEFSILGHLQRGSVRVKTGDRVRQGQVLGRLGNSGHSQGPHLHYHLMADSVLFRSDGLPSRFENTNVPSPPRGEPGNAR
ncbi:MAG TPA: M23 family metallopeptidase [Candidatus Limnocylindria bacterium]|nr:M23 family metallopeptidase [Candidatus Limnocylindria bacterium]